MSDYKESKTISYSFSSVVVSKTEISWENERDIKGTSTVDKFGRNKRQISVVVKKVRIK